MKKTKLFSLLMALFCVLTVSVTFAACGDDDDDPNKPAEGGDQTIKKINFTYEIDLCQKFFDIADVTVTYLDNNGNEQTETITSTTWTKTVSRTNAPASFNAKLSFTLKDGVDTSVKYDFTGYVGYSYDALNSQGKSVASNEHGVNINTEGAKGETIAKYLQGVSNTYTIKCNVNAKGLPE